MDVRPPTRALKSIDLNSKSFTANGKEYFIETAISFERYLMYQKLQIELGYAIGFEGVFKNVRKIYELCNQQKFADIAVLTHNILQGVKTVDERRIPAMEMCALFINVQDEDRGIITDDIVQAKIKDWEAEGLDVASFFAIAVAFTQGFATAYKEIIRHTSLKPESAAEEESQRED